MNEGCLEGSLYGFYWPRWTEPMEDMASQTAKTKHVNYCVVVFPH